MGIWDRAARIAAKLLSDDSQVLPTQPFMPATTALVPITKQELEPRRGALTMKELGSAGLKHAGGILQEEWLAALMGERGRRTYREMMDMDGTIGAVLFAIEMLIRQAAWDVEPASEDSADKENAAFLKQCMGDMDRTWTDFIADILSMLGFGWSVHELVYKVRRGDGKTRSKYTDGRIGWKRLPGRAQDTLDHWVLSDEEDVEAMVQVHPTDFRLITIPSWKFVHFRTTLRHGSPEGRSILRNAYRPWYFKKRLEEIEAVGIERDLAGIPVAQVPPEILSKNASADQVALLTQIKKIVRNIRVDEQQGIVWPLEYDDAGREKYKLTLLAGGGTKAFDPNQAIQRYRVEIATVVLADFILLGHEKVGSFALNSSKTALFSTALGAWLDAITDALNDQAVPRLFALNGFEGPLPKITHGDIETPDLAELGEYIGKLAGVGALTIPDDKLERYLRRAANLPEQDQEPME